MRWAKKHQIYLKLKDLYAKAGYGRLKFILKWNLFPFEEMEKYIPQKGRIIDIGCGEGIFSNLLVLRSFQREVIGIDLSISKFEIANKTVNERNNPRFINCDVRGYQVGKCDAVVMSDFLHHLSHRLQIDVLRKNWEWLTEGGILLIKEVNRCFHWRYFLSALSDFLLYPKEKVYFRSSEELIQILTKIGYKVELIPKKYPVSTNLYLCKKSK